MKDLPEVSMNIYDAEKIASICNGVIRSPMVKTKPVTELLIDSRKLSSADKCIFFAIKGDRRDGHRFIQDLIERGVKNFVVSDKYEIPANVEVNFIQVKDTLRALQTLASFHRATFDIPVIGITGSNGKTIVKEWLYQLLHHEGDIIRSPKSYNSQLGVPLSVWQMDENANLAIFEVGISQRDEMLHLEKIVKPTVGIFTNIGEAHSENFNSIDEKILEKLRLFQNTDLLIYCKDYSSLHKLIYNTEFLKVEQKRFTWSKLQNADLQIGRISKEDSGTDIQGIFKNNFINIRIPYTDDASVENAILCWCYMLSQGYAQSVISERMETLSPVAMRLEMKEGINNSSIINDSYNSDLGALQIALDFLDQQKQHHKKTVILSDILQSGKKDQNLYSEVAQLLAKRGISKLIGIGPNISKQADQFNNVDKQFFRTTEEFLRTYKSSWFKDETILIKGARMFGFEKISESLQQKAHETVMEINLDAITHNLNFFRSKIDSDVRIMAMVKAFSYGSGSFEIANVMQFHRVDYLAVAYADEGKELREAGITVPILVLNPQEKSFNTIIDFYLEPELYSFRILEKFEEALKRTEKVRTERQYPVHIKLDTGMHRLGFEPADMNELILRIKNTGLFRIVSVFSHLAASEDPEHDEFSRQQISSFTEMSNAINAHFNYPILRHILNSAGIIRFPEAHFDMVRLGIGMYGISTSPAFGNKLQTVTSLKGSISQIKNVEANESVGYARAGRSDVARQIATVGIGYADGLDRRLGNGVGHMVVAGKKVPVIGNVCMDMCMLDVTGMAVKEGDEVEVFGESQSVSELARQLGTIPYEVLAGIPPRVKRIYYQE